MKDTCCKETAADESAGDRKEQFSLSLSEDRPVIESGETERARVSLSEKSGR